jgi:hypothetical protein
MADDKEVRRCQLVEPGQAGLIGMTVITGPLKDRFYFGRSPEITRYRRVVQPGADKLHGDADDQQEEYHKTRFFPKRPGWLHIIELWV